MSNKYTRRRFLEFAGIGAASVALLGLAGCESADGGQDSAQPTDSVSGGSSSAGGGDVRTFRSRPDIRPPTVSVGTPARDGVADGYSFVAPKKGESQFGPLIVDNDGHPVWFRPVENEGDFSMDFKRQTYRGEPVIVWWEGEVVDGHGFGEWTVLDTSYREVARIRAGNGYQSDHHEILITPRGTAIFTVYGQESRDLTSVGGSVDDEVMDGIVQEIDIETGEVLFEWHSLDHVDIEETYDPRSDDAGDPFDYFHINSVDVDLDGSLLVSARRTHAIYKIDRESGEVIWRLGGKRSDFEMGGGTQTRYQHDARRRPDGTLTILDNGGTATYEESRGVVVNLDEDAMTAELVREYTHPDEPLAVNQANMQTLPNGNVFIGWGWAPVHSEFTSDGELLFSASLSPGANMGAESYRAYRFPWSAQPADERPAVAAERESGNEATLYVSWNGATEVAEWEALAGPGPGEMEAIGTTPRNGFETAITLRTSQPYVAVRAKDESGEALASSEATRLDPPN